VNDEPRTPKVEPRESDSPMTKTYVGVLLLEAAVITALFFFGRMFS
jgi:hypothetical protein